MTFAVNKTALLPAPLAVQLLSFIEAALFTIQFAARAALFQISHTVENVHVVTGLPCRLVLVVMVLLSVLEEWTLSQIAVVSGASVLTCICEQSTAVS